MIPRLCSPLKSHSFFLFGARGTGKTHLLREIFSNVTPLWIDLLRDIESLQYLRDPGLLEKNVLAHLTTHPNDPWVIIDEVQKAPALLDEVHRLIEEPKFNGKLRFALTGSSARKLKRGSANMLGGRALVNYLFPFTAQEIGDLFNLDRTLAWGSLPAVFNATTDLERAELLRSYVAVYLKEEIKEEQLIRKLDPFVRFLEVAAQVNGETLNYAKIGRDCQIDDKQVTRYFQILEDTLLGFCLEPFHESVRRRQSAQPKFYLFDIGVRRTLSGLVSTRLVPGSSEYGRAFEHFIVMECVRLNAYLRRDFKFSFFRSSDGFEIDLVIDRPGRTRALVEIKSSTAPDPTEIGKLNRAAPDFRNAEAFILCRAPRAATHDKVTVLPWQEGLSRIFE